MNNPRHTRSPGSPGYHGWKVFIRISCILLPAWFCILHCDETPVTPNLLPREKVYVANSGSNSVSVIDVEKAEVVATIDIGMPPFAIAPSKTEPIVYVSSREGQAIVEIDARIDEVAGVHSTGVPVEDITVGLDGHVYVVTLLPPGGNGTSGRTVGRLNLSSGQFAPEIAEFTSYEHVNLLVPATRTLITVTSSYSGIGLIVPGIKGREIGAFNTAVDTVMAWNASGFTQSGLLVTPNGRIAYVLWIEGLRILRIDLMRMLNSESHRDNGEIIVDEGPRGHSLVADFQRNVGYMVKFVGTLLAFDLANGRAAGEIPVRVANPGRFGTSYRTLTLAARGDRLYAVQKDDNSIAVLETSPLRMMGTIGGGTGPTAIAAMQ